MQEFTITENFPQSEIEFDARFSNPSACYDYLFSFIWPEAFSVKNVKTKTIGLTLNDYICVHCEHQNSLTAGYYG